MQPGAPSPYSPLCRLAGLYWCVCVCVCYFRETAGAYALYMLSLWYVTNPGHPPPPQPHTLREERSSTQRKQALIVKNSSSGQHQWLQKSWRLGALLTDCDDESA